MDTQSWATGGVPGLLKLTLLYYDPESGEVSVYRYDENGRLVSRETYQGVVYIESRVAAASSRQLDYRLRMYAVPGSPTVRLRGSRLIVEARGEG